MKNMPEFKYQALEDDFLFQMFPANDEVYFKKLSRCYLIVLKEMHHKKIV